MVQVLPCPLLLISNIVSRSGQEHFTRTLFWDPITDKNNQWSCQWIILTHIRQICHGLQAFLSRPTLPSPCIMELSLSTPYWAEPAIRGIAEPILSGKIKKALCALSSFLVSKV